MANVLLPVQFGGLPQAYCFESWNQFGLDLSNAQKAQLPAGMAFFNYGDTIPAPEYQSYPWLRSTDMRWYKYDGNWVSPNPETSSDARRVFVGAAADVDTYDGGSVGVVTNRSGPMWLIDSSFIGRVPIGVGLVPGSTTPAVTVAEATAMGAAEHTLTDAEGAVGQHTHAFGKFLTGAADFNYLGNQTVASYTGAVVQGISTGTIGSDTTVNLYTLPSGQTALGVTPTPFQVLQPGVGVYFIKRTARVFYVA